MPAAARSMIEGKKITELHTAGYIKKSFAISLIQLIGSAAALVRAKMVTGLADYGIILKFAE